MSETECHDPLTSPEHLSGTAFENWPRAPIASLTLKPGAATRVAGLRSEITQVLGVDVDPAIHRHPFLSSATVTEPGARLPYPDNHFDLIVSRYVLETHRGRGFRGLGTGTENGRKLFLGLHKALPEWLQTTMVIWYQRPGDAATTAAAPT